MHLKIKRVNELKNEDIIKFIKKIYSKRSFKIFTIYNWLYQVNTNKVEKSIVAINKNKIIAHAGIIPFKLDLFGKKIKGSWFTDFIVQKEYQNKGIGKTLTKNWLNFEGIGVTFCNDNSFRVFKKFGWLSNFKLKVHYILLRPFNHEKIYSKLYYISYLLKLLNFIFNLIVLLIIKFKIDNKDEFKINKLNFKHGKKFIKVKTANNNFSTSLDYDFLQWRFFKSPEINKYFFLEYKNKYFSIAKKRKEKKFNHYLDILIVNKQENTKDFKQFLLNILIWANDNKMSYVKILTSNNKFSKFLKKNFISVNSKPRFAYFSKNKSYLKMIEESNFNFQLFDSDFEFTD